jgi:RNA polymerase sigma-70 factor (ECF subfamily)
MAADSTTQLQGLIDRLGTGDSKARDELIARAYERLRRQVRKQLQTFPRVRSFEDTDDVLHDSLPRLSRALEAVPPSSVAEFFSLAGKQIRRELLNLIRRYYGPEGPGGKHVAPPEPDNSASVPPSVEVAISTDSPSALAILTEFHEAVESLPEAERAVFNLLYYLDMTQAEASSVLKVAEITVRRRWTSARRRLGDFLKGAEKSRSS